MSTADRWQTWASTLDVDGVGCRVATLPAEPAGGEDDGRAAALMGLGYLGVCPRSSFPLQPRDARLHRHVALLVDGHWSQACREWVRALARTSPRAHLVVVTRDPARRGSAQVRERAPVWRDVPDDPRWSRATLLVARGRRGAAVQWSVAAVAAAARRRDPGRFVALLESAWRVVRDDTAARQVLARHASSALDWLVKRDDYAAAVHQVARDAIEDAAFDRANALCAGLEIEFACDGDPVPPALRAVQMDVALWTGRFERAAALCDEVPDDERPWRQQVVAWLRGDHAAVTDPAGAGAIWTRAIDAVSTGRWSADRRGERRAERLLREAVTGVPGAAARADVWGAHGVRRWCLRRETMGMWGGVAALLEELNEAADEREVLERGCRWIRTHTGADHVAILAGPQQAILACDPSGSRLRLEDTRRPVRHSGVTIGWVSASGGRQVSSHEELEGCVTALASACAPAVRARLDALQAQGTGATLCDQLLGRSPAMVALRETIAKVAPTTFPVLVEGESGVGKELVARAIHKLSPRRDRTCAAINCAAITDELFEAEVFGHTRGAFTGAVAGRTGLFEEAHLGTLFLDEVGELSARAQAKLLRVLQDGQVRRIGDNAGRAVDVRIVAATNRVLAHEAREGRFREDLVFRLAVVRIQVPPLRERLEDIAELAAAFWARAVVHRPSRAWIGPDALAALCRHRWPGNIRELQNVVAGLVLAAPARGPVTARHVAEVLQGGGEVAPEPLAAARRRGDIRIVTAALARHAGCRAAAARDLGVSRQGLGKLMIRLGIGDEVATGTVLR